MEKKLFVSQAKLVRVAIFALDAQSGFENDEGLCWRWVRQVLVAAGVPKEQIPPLGVDALDALQWYVKQDLHVPPLRGSVPGDILFYGGPRHGKHGHVGIRIPGNWLAENSTYHDSDDDGEARGIRALKQVGKPSGIVRLWHP